MGETDLRVSELLLCLDLPVLDNSLSFESDVLYILFAWLFAEASMLLSNLNFVGDASKLWKLFAPFLGSSRLNAIGDICGDICSGLMGGVFIFELRYSKTPLFLCIPL